MGKKETIDFYCRTCKKSFKTSYYLTGVDVAPVLPNVAMKCHHCTKVATFKNYTEQIIVMNSKQGKCYI